MRRLLLGSILGVFLTLGVAPGLGFADQPVDEYRVKAAFLYNFARFTRWEATSKNREMTPLVIGVLGDNPFRGSLRRLEAKTIRNRPIKVRFFDNLHVAHECDLLFVSASEEKNLSFVLDLFDKQPTLLVSDIPDFAEEGGHIGLVSRGNKIRFRVNMRSLKDARITLSSKLLRLAEKVEGL